MKLQRIDHVGYAVEDLEAAVAYHERLYGAEVAHRESLERDGVHEALLAIGDGFIQLLAPSRPDSPVARFLERNGEGVHHIGYGVADVTATLSGPQGPGRPRGRRPPPPRLPRLHRRLPPPQRRHGRPRGARGRPDPRLAT